MELEEYAHSSYKFFTKELRHAVLTLNDQLTAIPKNREYKVDHTWIQCR
jgi:hypothetical protein